MPVDPKTMSVREMHRAGLTSCGSSAAIPDRRKAKEAEPGRRKFTDSFRMRQRVSIIRTEHGWFDGRLEGVIVYLSDYGCQVRDDEGGVHDIPKPRDIRGW